MQHDEIIRSMMRHEDELINRRIGWMFSFHGLLFAALAFAWDKNQSEALIKVFCVLGVAVSLLTSIALWVATLAQQRLWKWWQDTGKPDDYDGPDVTALAAARRPIIRYLAPWHVLPILFIAAWLFVFQINASTAG